MADRKHTPLSNAERQRRYRARHLKDPDGQAERIEVLASIHAKAALERLAHYWGTTQRATLERVLSEAQARILDTLSGEQRNRFYDRELIEAALQGNESREEALQGNAPASDQIIREFLTRAADLLPEFDEHCKGNAATAKPAVLGDKTARLESLLEPLQAFRDTALVKTFLERMEPILDGLRAESGKNAATANPPSVGYALTKLHWALLALEGIKPQGRKPIDARISKRKWVYVPGFLDTPDKPRGWPGKYTIQHFPGGAAVAPARKGGLSDD